ncbi:hypothetical protein thsps117_06020 [Pseudomonas sp. No.117]
MRRWAVPHPDPLPGEEGGRAGCRQLLGLARLARPVRKLDRRRAPMGALLAFGCLGSGGRLVAALRNRLGGALAVDVA